MPHRPRAAPGLAAALLALAVSLSACGGSGAPGASAPAKASSAASKAGFIAAAQAICRSLTAQEAPLRTRQESLKGLPTTTADSAFVALARHVAALSQSAGRKLQALPRPPADAGAIDRLSSDFSQDAAFVLNIADAAVKQEGTVGEADEDALKRSLAADRRLAQAYGMQECFGAE